MAIVTMREIQRELGMHPDTIRKLVREGKIPAIRARRGRGWYRFDLGAVRLAVLRLNANAGPERDRDGEPTFESRRRAIEAEGAAEFWKTYKPENAHV